MRMIFAPRPPRAPRKFSFPNFASFALFARDLLSRIFRRERLRITSIVAGIGQWYFVRGTAPKGKPLQVFVLAQDGRWYLQRHTTRLGKNWCCDVALGGEVRVESGERRDPNSELSTLNTQHSYIVAAVLTAERGQGPFDALPAGDKACIAVTRSAKRGAFPDAMR